MEERERKNNNRQLVTLYIRPIGLQYAPWTVKARSGWKLVAFDLDL